MNRELFRMYMDMLNEANTAPSGIVTSAVLDEVSAVDEAAASAGSVLSTLRSVAKQTASEQQGGAKVYWFDLNSNDVLLALLRTLDPSVKKDIDAESGERSYRGSHGGKSYTLSVYPKNGKMILRMHSAGPKGKQDAAGMDV